MSKQNIVPLSCQPRPRLVTALGAAAKKATVSDLRKACKALGVKGYSNKNKAWLIEHCTDTSPRSDSSEARQMTHDDDDMEVFEAIRQGFPPDAVFDIMAVSNVTINDALKYANKVGARKELRDELKKRAKWDKMSLDNAIDSGDIDALEYLLYDTDVARLNDAQKSITQAIKKKLPFRIIMSIFDKTPFDPALFVEDMIAYRGKNDSFVKNLVNRKDDWDRYSLLELIGNNDLKGVEYRLNKGDNVDEDVLYTAIDIADDPSMIELLYDSSGLPLREVLEGAKDILGRRPSAKKILNMLKKKGK